MTDDEISEILLALMPLKDPYFFARAIAAAEREACAKVAEAAAEKLGDLGRKHRDEGHEDSMDRCYSRALQCTQLAADIRTRSNVQASGAGAQATVPLQAPVGRDGE